MDFGIIGTFKSYVWRSLLDLRKMNEQRKRQVYL